MAAASMHLTHITTPEQYAFTLPTTEADGTSLPGLLDLSLHDHMDHQRGTLGSPPQAAAKPNTTFTVTSPYSASTCRASMAPATSAALSTMADGVQRTGAAKGLAQASLALATASQPEVGSWLTWGLLWMADLVEHGSILEAIDITVYIYVAFLALGIRTDVAGLLLGWVAAHVAYVMDRLKGASPGEADVVNDPSRSAWVGRHRKGLQVLCSCYLLALVGVVSVRPRLWWLLTCLPSALLYTAPLLPGGRSVKQVPGGKMAYVSLVIAAFAIGIPLCCGGTAWGPGPIGSAVGSTGAAGSTAVLPAFTTVTLPVAVILLVILAAHVNLCDLKDIEGDRLSSTHTLPVVLGATLARRLSLAVLTIAALAATAMGKYSLLYSSCSVLLPAMLCDPSAPIGVDTFSASQVLLLIARHVKKMLALTSPEQKHWFATAAVTTVAVLKQQ